MSKKIIIALLFTLASLNAQPLLAMQKNSKSQAHSISINIDDRSYSIHEKLGSGLFGTAYRATEQRTGKIVAVKIVEKDPRSAQSLDMSQRGNTILQNCNHFALVGIHKVWLDEQENKLYIVMDYIEGEDLFSKIINLFDPKEYLCEHTIALLYVRLLLALAYLADRGIVFRDLKPENIMAIGIMIDGDLCVNAKDPKSIRGGTPIYMAPECWAQPYHQSHKEDMWSLGGVLYACTNQSQPFRNILKPFQEKGWKHKDFELICDALRTTSYTPVNERYSPELRDVIAQLLKRDPATRPSAQELLVIPYTQRCLCFFVARIPHDLSRTLEAQSKILQQTGTAIGVASAPLLFVDDQDDTATQVTMVRDLFVLVAQQEQIRTLAQTIIAYLGGNPALVDQNPKNDEELATMFANIRLEERKR